MKGSGNTLYALKKDILDIDSDSSNRAAEYYIKKMQTLFLPIENKDFFKSEGIYHFSEDFVSLTKALKNAKKKPQIKKYINNCIANSISYEDMELFLRYLKANKEEFKFSESLFLRICQVHAILKWLAYTPEDNKFITDLKKDNDVKKKLLFYIIAKNYKKLHIFDSLTLTDIWNKFFVG